MPPPPLPRPPSPPPSPLPPPPPSSQESPSPPPDLSLTRNFSGDFGGGFGGDGGILQKECTSRSGGSGPGQRQQLRSQTSRPVDVEKLGGDLRGNGVVGGGGGSEFVVNWINGDDDPENPKAMSNTRKWICTCVVSLSSLCVTCTSSIYSSTYAQITHAFHAPRLLAIAGLSLFVMGLGIGPMFLAPLSEFYGRRPIYLVSFSIFTLFLLPCALAPNIAVLLVFRFMTGFAGSAFLSVAGGTVGDMFVRSQLGAPMMIYTASPFIGPELGPLIGGFVNQNVDWRWTFWIVMIWSAGNLVGLWFLVPETYHPVLLRHRAERMRRETGEERYRAPIEMLERSIPRTILLSAKRPFELLLFEPMLLMLCLFSAILLGILYLFFEAFPLVFSTVHNFTLDKIGLTFLGLFVGMVLGILSDPLWTHIYHTLTLKNSSTPQPEFRLPPVMAGSLLVPTGLFWFAWTTYHSIHWIVPIIGSSVFALGLLLVFSGVFTFLVEAYPLYAASALAANSFVRSAAAAGFPLFSEGMYRHLGFQWATALLGFLAGGMAPFAFLFFKYGEKIRTKSRYATASVTTK